MPDYRWRARFASVTEDKIEFMEMFENIPSATNRMKSALTILRIMGYFCGFHRDERRKKFKRKLVQSLLILISLSVLGFNLNIYRHNVYISLLYNSHFGFLHGATVSHLISGIKPLINAVLVILFIWRIGKHKRMLRILDTVDLCFR
uniref:Uncharacterized protein n=1 Tax=Panagrolaimus sp. JU765 TaxID=591449 RepID=A0AC34Q9E8_9BILA